MSGPDPFRPKPGSNGIGEFIIGVSPIGDIPPFDFWQTIISQYANSNVITTLIGNFDACVDQTANLGAFYDLIMNVASAQGYGLDVWGRIVGVSRTLNVGNTAKFFGFDEAGNVSADPFNVSPFFVGQPLTTNFNLDDEPYRTLVFAKAFANICDGSIKSINQMLRTLFPGRGNCFVTDGLNMTMAYTFQFQLSPVELAIVSQSGVLPKSTGVLASVVVAV
jgi:Protein of unknown function (DUF2612)